MTEEPRGCGYRKVGGLYLVGGLIPAPCDRLPFPLKVCKACGHGIRQSRGWTWVAPAELLGGDHPGASGVLCDCQRDLMPCPVCKPDAMGKRAGLLWVGKRFYTTRSFMEEAFHMGISRRIKSVPHGFKLGETWVMLAHPRAVSSMNVTMEQTKLGSLTIVKTIEEPAIFTVFKPVRIEKLIWESDATSVALHDLEQRGITPVIIKDGDPNHDPSRRITADVKMLKEREKKTLIQSEL